MFPEIPDPANFGISPKYGFLSSEEPLSNFPNPYYEPWDSINANLIEMISSRTLQTHVDNLPFLNTSNLTCEIEYRRAYVVLAYMVHAYVWSERPPNPNVPPQIAEPFLAVCDHLGLEPVLSYAGLCVWNWKWRTLPNEAMDLKDIEVLASFTGTPDETAFLHVPVIIEAEGGKLMHLLLNAISKAQEDDVFTVISALDQCDKTIVRMGEHMAKLYATLDAQCFYHEIRPFIAGGKGMEEKGLPRGMVFQKRDGTEECYKCVGGNAGQSSLFQFLDYALGVEHEPPEVAADESVFEMMRRYMPGAHRRFLESVSKLPSIRDFVEQHPSNNDLRQAYDGCLKQLRSWRSKHIAVVSKYIVQPARLAQTGSQDEKVEKLEVEGGSEPKNKEWELQGTGGTALIPFLRQARDDTVGMGGK